MSTWSIVGFGLLAWACYDIAKGRTYLWREISRAKEPWLFWPIALLWSFLALYLILSA